jgi:competence protein ComEA
LVAGEQHKEPGSHWPRPAQLAAAFLLGIGSTLLAVRLVGAPPRPLDFRPAAFDLNRADRAQLLQLPGVGPTLADRITAVRDERGGFDSPADLRTVPGFGPARFERIRPLIRADGSPTPPRESTKQPAEPIDINSASVGELEKLPGIGPKMAQRIVDERAKKPFASVDDLRGRVSGIGAKTLEKLRPYVKVKGRNADSAN